jgi:hypothetical protein
MEKLSKPLDHESKILHNIHVKHKETEIIFHLMKNNSLNGILKS